MVHFMTCNRNCLKSKLLSNTTPFRRLYFILLLAAITFHFSVFAFFMINHSLKNVSSEIHVPGQIRSVKLYVNFTETSRRPIKTILLWTTIFNKTYDDDFYCFPQEGTAMFQKFVCEFHECFVSADKRLRNEADAIIFHARDFSVLPKPFKEHQIKIFYNLEPPWSSGYRWKIARNFFNWTMTYRTDSDVQVKYGDFWTSHSQLTQNVNYNRMRSILSRKQDKAIWIASNCHTQSGRERYIKNLQKYYPVDIFGRCGPNTCKPKQSAKCYETLLPKYKFYLAFENSICDDYVSEKFFNVLKYDIVPVVMGGANYKEIAPPNSFINALEFPNPKDLANYLLKVSNDDDLYVGFFLWKTFSSVHLHSWMCELCKKLHLFNDSSKVIENIASWWDDAHCKQWTARSGFKALSNVRRRPEWGWKYVTRRRRTKPLKGEVKDTTTGCGTTLYRKSLVRTTETVNSSGVMQKEFPS